MDSTDGCTCQSCGRTYKVDLLVSDELWKRIRPAGKAEGAGMLCGGCMVLRIEGLGMFGVYRVGAVKKECDGCGRDPFNALCDKCDRLPRPDHFITPTGESDNG